MPRIESYPIAGTAVPPIVRLPVTYDVAAARAYADSLIVLARSARTPRTLRDEVVIAVGYLERLRLGLGSPFRLMEHALRDRRLSDVGRVRLAEAILARTQRGDAYQVDAGALDWIGGGVRAARSGVGDRHLALIDSTIMSARDPRAGELAVRLAYAIVIAEGWVSERAKWLSAGAAALLRDRALAIRDASALLRAARASGVGALALVRQWRAERRFLVEQPPLAGLPSHVEPEALLATRGVIARLRRIGRPDVAAPTQGPTRPDDRPLLSSAAARRLARLATAHEAPPQAPIVGTLYIYRKLVLGSQREPGRSSRARFLERARTEESLAAQHAAAVSRQKRSDTRLSLAMLQAAVALRTYAQEPAWVPGDGGPTVRDLKRQYGFASVSFDAEVPTAWRPFYRRMLDHAVTDMWRVLPGLTLRGLGVHIGRTPLSKTAFASHGRTTRTLYLPPPTAAGTLAHELAHDLDWYAVKRGSYTTDRAIRTQQQSLAAVLGRLTTDSLVVGPPERPDRARYHQRPSEVFARSVEWFVAVSLAHEGRMNGYLSTVQDELLTGYTHIPPPDVTGKAGAAIVELLDSMTFVPKPIGVAFLTAYGPNRALTAFDQVRRVLALPPPEPSSLKEPPATRPPALPLSAPEASTPLRVANASEVAGSDRQKRLAQARRSIVEVAAEARARAILRRWAKRPATPEDPVGVRALRAGPLAPDKVDAAVAQLRDTLLARLSTEMVAREPFATPDSQRSGRSAASSKP